MRPPNLPLLFTDEPLETTNLAGRPECKPRMADLAERIRAWQRRTGDAVELPRSL